ncbi:hypothetical protein PISMIDRAFT_102069 [Pisolithus microcarpus 441]|uniref:Uncharacterized protein n=1 Tax=Pisolithus microcarpus 441 TaxID=765257 RepID=A0A0C9Z0R7_9AGAM|nr:hypothetical protein BKA83DRAFT_102069 [Pisolithus microcarpus]KIK22656.1 hypothetical protein PISMIDRAFT_102069 [Pisolithus microcarpus 441]
MTAPNIPSVTRIINARDRLMASGLYLGDSTITNNLRWVRSGRADILCSVADVVSDGDDTTANTTANEPAILRAIVRIDSADFWLTADGGYLGPNSIWKEIVDVKPSCTVTDPGIDPVTSDFAVVIHVLQQLTANCVTPGYTSGKSFFSTKDLGTPRFKLCHTLFQVRGLVEEVNEETITPVTSDVTPTTPDKSDTSITPEQHCPPSDAFSLELWPLTKEKNRAELLALKNTHHIVPLPAYDLSNDIIRPASYRRILQGAIVEVHFTLSHWAIATAKRDVYGGDIQRIRLLVPPTWSSSTKKRKIPFHLDTEESGSIKRVKV